MSAIYRYRDGLASAPALLLLAAMQLLIARPSPAPAWTTQTPIEITLLAPAQDPRPSPPQPHESEAVPPPLARPRPMVTPKESPARQANAPIPVADPAVETTTADLPMAVPRHAAPQKAEATPPAESVATPFAPPPAPPRTNAVADLEAAYIGRVRQLLNAIKRYPTGREASLLRPSGTVRVWLVLDRGGRLLDRGIESSSQSLLLDNAALRTVSSAAYPPFPEELWPGQTQRRFHVDIDFVIPDI